LEIREGNEKGMQNFSLTSNIQSDWHIFVLIYFAVFLFAAKYVHKLILNSVEKNKYFIHMKNNQTDLFFVLFI